MGDQFSKSMLVLKRPCFTTALLPQKTLKELKFDVWKHIKLVIFSSFLQVWIFLTESLFLLFHSNVNCSGIGFLMDDAVSGVSWSNTRTLRNLHSPMWLPWSENMLTQYSILPSVKASIISHRLTFHSFLKFLQNMLKLGKIYMALWLCCLIELSVQLLPRWFQYFSNSFFEANVQIFFYFFD